VLTTLRNRLRADEGFTLIELLVVILIIGILAAIAIPSFLNQKGKGEDSAAKSAARNAQTSLETYYTDNSSYDCSAVTASGGYALGCDTALHTIEPNLPPYGAGQGQLSVSGAGGSGNPTATAYRVTVVSKPSGRTFWVDKNGGTIQRGCAVNGAGSAGGCNNSSW
jgi:type IV pilus assembly protein PilA